MSTETCALRLNGSAPFAFVVLTGNGNTHTTTRDIGKATRFTRGDAQRTRDRLKLDAVLSWKK